MIEKAPFDLDAALAALGRGEAAARPAVSESLQARVLASAAAVAAGRATIDVKAPRRAAPRLSRGRLFGLFDIWGGAALGAMALCLLVGFGLGYEAGPAVAERAGLDGMQLAQVQTTDDSDAGFLWEDVL